ncbi:MAG: hypothetical protein HYV26_22325, partial [Candidatus Hydrogenedentes bacterium]|nr:hypothetical protein [Candidatus Hydrogenedentota bacterium]
MDLQDLAKQLEHYVSVLEPDQNAPEWWAGAPSVLRLEDGATWLAARMRNAEAPKGQRGYETRILSSPDGVHFTPQHSITRQAAGIPGFERPALVKDPKSGLFRLYTCALYRDRWAVWKFEDAAQPNQFKPETIRPVLFVDTPDDDTFRVTGYKDP